MLGLWVLFGGGLHPCSSDAGLRYVPCSASCALAGGTPAWVLSSLAKHLAVAAAEGLLCSIPDVCVLHWWKDPHVLCSPLGLINGVIYRLAD